MIVMAAGTRTDIIITAHTAVRLEFAIRSTAGGRDAAIECRVGCACYAQETESNSRDSKSS